MNTFNNLAVSTAKQMTAKAGDLGIVLPETNRKDRRKLKPFISKVKAAIHAGNQRHANSNHWKWSKAHGWKSVDVLGSLLNGIERFQKLNPGVLDGGAKLKSAWLETAWLAYAKLETHGIDNAHFQQWDLPCDQYGREDIYTTPNRGRKLADLPDSKLEPEQQWQALELVERFTQPDRETQPEPIDYGVTTPCAETAGQGIPTSQPEWFGTARIEVADPNANLTGSVISYSVEWQDTIGHLLGERTANDQAKSRDRVMAKIS